MISIILLESKFKKEDLASLSSTSKIKGQVIVPQLKSLDYVERNGQFIEKIGFNELEQINQLIYFMFE